MRAFIKQVYCTGFLLCGHIQHGI